MDERVRCIHLAGYGGAGQAPVPLPVAAILDDAARHGSAGLLVASRERCGHLGSASFPHQAAVELADAADAIGVTLVDYLVFRAGDCTSLRRSGML